MFCRNCGVELPANTSICPKCGTAVNPSGELRVKEPESAVVKKTSAKKNVLIAVIVLVVVLGAILAWSFFRPKDPGYYQDIAWGTSYEDFMQEHPKAFGDKKADGSANVFSMDGKDLLQGFEEEEIDGTTLLMYQFDKSGLYTVSWSALQSDRAEELVPEIIKKYSKLYGKPTRSDDPETNKDFDEYNYIWKTKESVVQLLAIPNTGDVMVIQKEIGHSEEE